MARQWRIEFSGALYHVLSRGNGCQDISFCDNDRHLFLDLLAELSEQFNIWEDVKHGLIYGGQEFIEDIKTQFLGHKKDAKLPQHNSLLRTFDPELVSVQK